MEFVIVFLIAVFIIIYRKNDGGNALRQNLCQE